MADHPTPFKPLDPGRINVIDREELEYWSRELHCTETELAEAVIQAGEHTTAVRDYLAARKPSQ
jgi:Protein of unknown function (DUF3606)